METSETISSRASLKLKLTPRDVEQEKINKVLEAARLAPSARNTQPWRFIVVKDKQIIETMANKAFTEVNRVVKEAPVIIVACANPSDDVIINGKEYYMFDLGLSMQNLMLTATDMGLATHIMAGFDEDAMRNILKVPDEVRIPVAMPLSYPAGDSYKEAAQERLSQRTRKDLNEIVYYNTWANSP